MKLKELISKLEVESLHGPANQEIRELCFDSRSIAQGDLYVAMTGSSVDGHEFIQQAIDAGAVVIVCEKLPATLAPELTFVQLADTRLGMAELASAWYNRPSEDIKLVGITGTNGKTTVASLLYQVHVGLGYKVGMLSTIEVLINGEKYPATHTTPDPLQVNKWIRQMVDAGCEYCFMEVSSHAVAQERIAGLHFNGGVFTNLSHDHLDYHSSFKEYLEAKQAFFTVLSPEAFALTNANDKNGDVMLQLSKAVKYRYGIGRMTDFNGKIVELHFDGMELQLNQQELWVRLTGRFNAQNILAVYASSVLLGHESAEVLEQLSKTQAAEGRFEVYKSASGNIGIVDYAHTDDALQNVLETIHELNVEGRQVITVVGAGGDRDKSKRPKMGKVAAMLSSKVVLTSDNPRSERTEDIMNEMEAGIPFEKSADVLKISDREEAIKTACMLGSDKAVILLAGKGHEKYQIMNGEKLHFDDKEMIIKYLK